MPVAGGCSSGVERQLPKLNVEGSNPFTRSSFSVYISVSYVVFWGLKLLRRW